MFPKDIHKKTYILGIIFIICFLIFSAIANYYTWSSGPNNDITYFSLIIWTILYLPIFIFYKLADWKIKDFGYSLNYKIIILTVLTVIILIINISSLSFYDWKSSLVEMYARTGEELFFRGFIYMLALKLLKNKNKPWIWASLISSICFTLVHTQTFLPNNSSTMIDVFIIAVILSLLRHWTKSILPGIIIHIFLRSNILGIIFGIIFYYLGSLIAYIKGEDILKKVN